MLSILIPIVRESWLKRVQTWADVVLNYLISMSVTTEVSDLTYGVNVTTSNLARNKILLQWGIMFTSKKMPNKKSGQMLKIFEKDNAQTVTNKTLKAINHWDKQKRRKKEGNTLTPHPFSILLMSKYAKIKIIGIGKMTKTVYVPKFTLN